jgi:riboflavin kinase/FMN adenylyltransferase
MAAQKGVFLLMIVLQSIKNAKFQNAWVTIGSFDGVHIGHQALIKKLVQTAHAAGDPAVAVTFYPLPAVVLRNIHESFYLTDLHERTELLGTLGLDGVITMKFDQTLAKLSADEFINLLVKYLGLKQLWIGEGFALGKDRQGTIEYLRDLSCKLNFTVLQNEIIKVVERPVSSSQIRNLIANGGVDIATELLGRPYRLTGKVIHGEGRGHRLGIPTANLEIPKEKLLPGVGIYATWLWRGRKRFPSVTNIGFRPTFEVKAGTPIVEPYIMDFDQGLYGEQLTVEFLKYLRPEEKFDSAEKLVSRIKEDIHQAEEVFTNAPRTPGISS